MKAVNWIFVGSLAFLSWLAPLPLYLVALTCFGLPHVFCELRWIRHTSAKRFPGRWWLALGALLLVQAGSRLLSLVEQLPAGTALTLDVLTLLLAVLLVFWPSSENTHRQAWAARVAALLFAAILLSALANPSQQYTVVILLLLSAIHNFTPLGLVRLHHWKTGPSPTRALRGMFTLPVVAIFFIPFADLGWMPEVLKWGPPEFLWIRQHTASPLAGLLSALVLAQCLHYYAVIWVLPTAAGLRQSWSPWVAAAFVFCLIMSVTFCRDFLQARKIYAIASGMHAWLEWPLLLACIGNYQRTETGAVEPASPAIGTKTKMKGNTPCVD